MRTPRPASHEFLVPSYAIVCLGGCGLLRSDESDAVEKDLAAVGDEASPVHRDVNDFENMRNGAQFIAFSVTRNYLTARADIALSLRNLHIFVHPPRRRAAPVSGPQDLSHVWPARRMRLLRVRPRC